MIACKIKKQRKLFARGNVESIVSVNESPKKYRSILLRYLLQHMAIAQTYVQHFTVFGNTVAFFIAVATATSLALKMRLPRSLKCTHGDHHPSSSSSSPNSHRHAKIQQKTSNHKPRSKFAQRANIRHRPKYAIVRFASPISAS